MNPVLAGAKRADRRAPACGPPILGTPCIMQMHGANAWFPHSDTAAMPQLYSTDVAKHTVQYSGVTNVRGNS